MSEMRIISLVPSLTHTVCELGLTESLVGCTSFCIEPPSLRRTCTSIGGTKDPDLAKIRDLKPTHILTNDEENKPEHIQACKKIAPTLETLPKGPLDVPGLLVDMGRFLNCDDAAHKMKTDLEETLKEVRKLPLQTRRILYFIWRNPWMVVGEGYLYLKDT